VTPEAVVGFGHRMVGGGFAADLWLVVVPAI